MVPHSSYFNEDEHDWPRRRLSREACRLEYSSEYRVDGKIAELEEADREYGNWSGGNHEKKEDRESEESRPCALRLFPGTRR
jgi:hypothetical protein